MTFLGRAEISAGRSIKLIFKNEDISSIFDNLVESLFENGLLLYMFGTSKIKHNLDIKEKKLYDEVWKYFDREYDKIKDVAKKSISNKIKKDYDVQINLFKNIVISLSNDFGINDLYMMIFDDRIELRIKTKSVSYRKIWLNMKNGSDILDTSIFGVERNTKETYKSEELPYNEYPKDYFTKKGLSSKYPIKFLPIRDKFFESIKYTIPKRIKDLEKSYQDDIATAEEDILRELYEKSYKRFLKEYKNHPKTVTFTSAINPYKFEENTVVLVPRDGDFNEKSGFWDYIRWQVFENGERLGYEKNLDRTLNHYLNITYQAWKENEKN